MRRPLGGILLGFVLVLTLWAPSRTWATGAVMHKSGAIQITPDGQFVWIVNPDHNSVSRITVGSSFYLVVQFPLPPPAGQTHKPQGLAITHDNTEVWVACHDSNRIVILDQLNGGLAAELPLPAGSGPVAIAISPDGAKALVTLHRSGAVAVFDVATRTQTALIEGLYRRPWGIAFTSTPGQAFIAHTVSDGLNSYVTVLNTDTNTVRALVQLQLVNPRNADQVFDEPDPIPEGGYIVLRGHIAQPPGSDDMWLPVQYNNFINAHFTADSAIQAAIHKVNTQTLEHYIDNRTVLTAVRAHRQDGSTVGDGWDAHIAGPVDLAFSADGAMAFIVNMNSNDVVVVPTNIGLDKPVGSNPLTEIAVGDNPIGIVASPTSDKLFVANYLSRNVSVINMTTLAEEARLNITFPTPEPIPASVLAGQKFFMSSADTRLSVNQKASCDSCHPHGEGDALPWEFAQFGAGTRKTLNLLGIGLTAGPAVKGRGQFHRGGDRDELQDFDFTFRMPFMGGTGLAPEANVPLGKPNAGLNADLDAFAAFMTQLAPVKKSPHRAADGSLSESAVRGAALFKATSGPFATNCNSCHTAPTFVDLQFHDVGGFAPTPELQGPLFNTPTLVGAWDLPPYSNICGTTDADTLGGVLRTARNGLHGNTAGLSQTQMRDLEAFLMCIDGQMSQDGIADVDDVTPPRIVAVRPISLSTVEVIFSEAIDPITGADLANYSFFDGLRTYAPTAAVIDAARGNRVMLSIPLAYYGCTVAYTLTPGPIQDVAAVVRGEGENNALDVNDEANHAAFTLDGTITVTFGDTGDETFPGVSREASFNASLSALSHDFVRAFASTNPPTKGFISFDFITTLTEACGVTDAADILDASFSLQPKLGATNTLELRRCLKPWNPPSRNECVGCAGSLTRQHATFNTIPWAQSGARSLGGSGTDPAEYYPTGTFDTAADVDAFSPVASMNTRTVFSGPGVTDAFRFWFANPTLNRGYAINATNASVQGTEFWGSRAEEGRHGPTLTVTFAIHAQTPPDCNANSIADDCEIRDNPSLDANNNLVLDTCESGACCFPEAPCQLLFEADCTKAGGSYLGNNTTCGNPACPCPPDVNHDGMLNSQDFFDFLIAFFALKADYNENGVTDSQDFFDYLTDFFRGCF